MRSGGAFGEAPRMLGRVVRHFVEILGRLLGGVASAAFCFCCSTTVLVLVLWVLCQPKDWQEKATFGGSCLLLGFGGLFFAWRTWQRATVAQGFRDYIRSTLALTVAMSLAWLGGGVFDGLLAAPIWLLMGEHAARTALTYAGWIPVAIGASPIQKMVEGVWLGGA